MGMKAAAPPPAYLHAINGLLCETPVECWGHGQTYTSHTHLGINMAQYILFAKGISVRCLSLAKITNGVPTYLSGIENCSR